MPVQGSAGCAKTDLPAADRDGQKVTRMDDKRTMGSFDIAAIAASLPERATSRVLPSIPGVVPGQFDRPPGCQFSPRCAFATARCRAQAPPRASPALGHALCWTPLVDGRPTETDRAA